MATGARGEVTITLEAGEATLLFTNKALAQAEKSMGKSVIGLVNGFADGQAGIGDLAALMQAGMEAARRDARTGGRPVSLNDAYDVLDEVGFAAAATAVMEGVAAVLGYSREELDEEAAEKHGSGACSIGSGSWSRPCGRN